VLNGRLAAAEEQITADRSQLQQLTDELRDVKAAESSVRSELKGEYQM